MTGKGRFARVKRRGFSLVELVSVAAIVTILATVAVTALGTLKRSGNQARSLSNLRTIASSVLLYHADFQKLPGPTWTTVSAPEFERDLSPEDQALNLRRLLIDYIPEERNVWVGSIPETINHSKNMVAFMLNNRTTTQPRRFFGYPGSWGPLGLMEIVAAGREGQPSFQVRQLSKIWMISDADNLNLTELPKSPEFAPLRGGRNYAFFDGHAKFLRDDERPANADGRGDPR